MKKEANFTPAAGQAISLIDAWVTDQDGWSIFDAIDDQHKVYLCDGGATDFYLYVDDDQNNYSKLYLWEGWNNESHEGSGNNTTTMYLIKGAGSYRCVGNSTYISVYHGDSTSNNWGFYAGYFIPLIETDTKCIGITGDSSLSPGNTLFLYNAYANGYFLFPFAGGLPTQIYTYMPNFGSYMSIAINNQGLCLLKVYAGENLVNKKNRCTYQDIFGCGSTLPTGFAVNDLAYIGGTAFVIKKSNAASPSYYFIKNG